MSTAEKFTGWSGHPVDVLKQLGMPMTPEAEQQARAICDEPYRAMKTIPEMAAEAGFEIGEGRIHLTGQGEEDWWASVEEYPCGISLMRFAALVRAEALEESAAICDGGSWELCNAAAAIRAAKEAKP